MITAATLEVAVAKAIIPFDMILASNARYKNVFHVPPGPCTKKHAFSICVDAI